jgi:hypothetical protein
MVQHLSDNELERISEFANTPSYKRSPEQLLPEETVDDLEV